VRREAHGQNAMPLTFPQARDPSSEDCADMEAGDEVREEMKGNINRPMRISEFNANKREIMKLLRSKGDDFPVCNVIPGKNPLPETPLVLRKLIRHPENTSRLIRGYKLVVLVEEAGRYTYAAQPYLALKRSDNKLASVTKDERFGNTPFIFVPSSRMHPEMTDDEILSGKWQFATVLAGNRFATQSIMRTKQAMSIFERKSFVLCPQDAEAIPYAFVRHFPSFNEFISTTTFSFDTPVDVAICFGMPYKYLGEDELESINLGTAAAGVSCGPENVNPTDFIEPKAPWMVDKEAWLPSVQRLHALIRSMYIDCEVPPNLHNVLIMAMYTVLGKEYNERIDQANTRYIKEHAAMISSVVTFC